MEWLAYHKDRRQLAEAPTTHSDNLGTKITFTIVMNHKPEGGNGKL